MIHSLRNEALLILEGHGAILNTAREVTTILRQADLEGAIIDGVAVVLHGHIRTTMDVDVFVVDALKPVATALTEAGFSFDPSNKEFVKEGVPVHLVLSDQTQFQPGEFIEIENIRTVSLADLISMKLKSGSSNPLRAQDMADVIGLIRHHGLTGEFAPKIAKEIRQEFRKLAKSIHGAK